MCFPEGITALCLSCLILNNIKMKNLARKTVLVFTLMMSLTVLGSNTKVESKDKTKKLTNVYFKNVDIFKLLCSIKYESYPYVNKNRYQTWINRYLLKSGLI